MTANHADDNTERELLELKLYEWLDEDDAVTAVQEMLAAGWRPPSEVASERRRADNLANTLRTVLNDVYCGCETCELWEPPLTAALAVFDHDRNTA